MIDIEHYKKRYNKKYPACYCDTSRILVSYLDEYQSTEVNDIRDNKHTREWWLKESIIASAWWWEKEWHHWLKKRRLFIWKRHCHCAAHMIEEWFGPTTDTSIYWWWFLTSKKRYVSREEWMIIACKFWQVTDKVAKRKDTDLYSEDLR